MKTQIRNLYINFIMIKFDAELYMALGLILLPVNLIP